MKQLWPNLKRCLRSRASWQEWKRWWRFYDYKHLVYTKLEGQTMSVTQYRIATRNAEAFKQARVIRGFLYWLTGYIKYD